MVDLDGLAGEYGGKGKMLLNNSSFTTKQCVLVRQRACSQSVLSDPPLWSTAQMNKGLSTANSVESFISVSDTANPTLEPTSLTTKAIRDGDEYVINGKRHGLAWH